MVLIEVLELIVNIDGRLDLLRDYHLFEAVIISIFGAGAIVDADLLDLVTHNVKHDTQTQKDDTENAKGDHG